MNTVFYISNIYIVFFTCRCRCVCVSTHDERLYYCSNWPGRSRSFFFVADAFSCARHQSLVLLLGCEQLQITTHTFTLLGNTQHAYRDIAMNSIYWFFANWSTHFVLIIVDYGPDASLRFAIAIESVSSRRPLMPYEIIRCAINLDIIACFLLLPSINRAAIVAAHCNDIRQSPEKKSECFRSLEEQRNKRKKQSLERHSHLLNGLTRFNYPSTNEYHTFLSEVCARERVLR